MQFIRVHSSTSNTFRVTLRHSTTGQGLTGLTEASAGLIIGTIADNEATTTRYRASSSEIETIATLGTFAAPSASKCRFKEVDATNHPGEYEIQLADARFAVASAKQLTVTISGATNLLAKKVIIQLSSVNLDNAVNFGLSAIPNAAPDDLTNGGLLSARKLRKYLQLLFRSDAAIATDNAAELTELNANGGSGAGDASNQTDALESLRDNLALAATALSTAQWTNALATALGTLASHDPGSQLASSSEVTAVQNNTRVVRVVPPIIERPDAGTMVHRIELFLYDSAGNMEAPDAAPTIELVDNAGNDHSLMLDSTTMTPLSTGHYRALLTVASSSDLEQLIFTFSVTEGGEVRKYGNTAIVVDTSAVDFTSADRTKLDAIHGKLPSNDIADQTLLAAAVAAISTTLGAAGAGLTGIPRTGYKLAADGLDAVLIESAISASAALTNDSGTQLTSINGRQALALLLSALAAKLAGAPGPTTTTKPAAKPAGNNRIAAAVDATGRTSVTLVVPD